MTARGAERQLRGVRVLGVRVDALSQDDVLERMEEWAAKGPPLRQVVTVNPEMVMTAQRDAAFRQVLEEAELACADGAGIYWAARRQGLLLPGRVTGADLLPAFAGRAAGRGLRIFLLGSAPGVAAQAAAVLQRLHPGLQVAGTHPGAPWGAEADTSVRMVREARPDALFVAFGSPAQDAWIARHRAELPGGVAVGVGGAFDFLTGRQKRAPAWVRRAQMEWAYRLLRQPWRWRRQLALPRFALAASRPAAVEPLW